VGAELEVDGDLRPELLLFHEGPSRIMISTAQPEAVEEIARKHSVEAPRIGTTAPARLTIRGKGRDLVDCGVERLKGIWASALEKRLRA
jgi:phosphoribosylformylglycinamidine synthase